MLPTPVSTSVPTRGRRLVLAVPSLLLTLTLAACGDDDGGGEDGTESPAEEASAISRDDFVAQANEICAEGNRELEAAGQEVDPTDPEAIPMFATEVLVPNIRDQVEDIRALGFPEGDQELIESTLDDASAALDTIEADPGLLAKGPNPFEDVNAVLSDYGLTECGSE